MNAHIAVNFAMVKLVTFTYIKHSEKRLLAHLQHVISKHGWNTLDCLLLDGIPAKKAMPLV